MPGYTWSQAELRLFNPVSAWVWLKMVSSSERSKSNRGDPNLFSPQISKVLYSSRILWEVGDSKK